MLVSNLLYFNYLWDIAFIENIKIKTPNFDSTFSVKNIIFNNTYYLN